MNTDPQAPIGVFDSGIGGLSVLRHLVDEMPAEHYRYIADSGFAPYGARSPQEIEARSRHIASLLVGQGVKALVVACNTATAHAIESLRDSFSLPIIGIEPGLKPAAQATRNGTVGILATQGTLSSPKFDRLMDRFGHRVRVINQVCNGLADRVEQCLGDHADTRAMLKHYLEPLLRERVDTLVLGCTHYPFLIPGIAKIAGPGVSLIDTGIPVARETRRRLQEDGLLNPGTAHGQILFYSSEPGGQALSRIRHYWPDCERVEELPRGA